MSTLTVRILEDHKDNLSQGALRAGLARVEEGEVRGNISALIALIAQALPGKSESEIKDFLAKKPN